MDFLTNNLEWILIGFMVAEAGDLTSLQIYNIQGRLLKILTDQYFTPGHYYEFE